MFFAERVKSIGKNDVVLEIGPGATPHPRSNVFLEKNYDSKEELYLQSGNAGFLKTDKKVVFYDGGKFPFKDNEFDYVICSHVLEHVDDVPEFISEIQRVAKRGYLEFPSIYYDYFNDIPTHLNMLRYKDGEILWCKKSDTPIPDLKPFTSFFSELQEKGYRMQKEVTSTWHIGFEWESKVKNRKVQHWAELCHTKEELNDLILEPKKENDTQVLGIKGHFKGLIKSIFQKFK